MHRIPSLWEEKQNCGAKKHRKQQFYKTNSLKQKFSFEKDAKKKKSAKNKTKNDPCVKNKHPEQYFALFTRQQTVSFNLGKYNPRNTLKNGKISQNIIRTTQYNLSSLLRHLFK